MHAGETMHCQPCYNAHLPVIDTLNAPVITDITLSTQILWTHNFFLICQIVLKFWTERGNIIAVLLTKF